MNGKGPRQRQWANSGRRTFDSVLLPGSSHEEGELYERTTQP